jgi:hypothetical protein
LTLAEMSGAGGDDYRAAAAAAVAAAVAALAAALNYEMKYSSSII